MKLAFANGLAQQWAVFTVAICGSVLCGALYFEFVLGLAPCPLCVMQRIWFVLAAAFAYISLLHNPRWGIYPLLTALCAIVGGGFSIRQLWLQSLPADQVPACGPDLQYMLEVFPLGELLTAMTSGTGDCAATVWSFLGLSIPAWALLAFVAVLVCAVQQLRRGLR